MSIVNLLFSALVGKRTTIGVLELDALLTETTSLSSQITEYPVEDGTVISDHITQESERLSLSGVITGAGTLFNVGLGKYKLISAKETLRELHANRELITIVTGLDVYEDFAIESLEIERNSDDGERLNITAEFRKINKVTLRAEEMPPEKVNASTKGKAGQTKANAGKAATGKPTDGQARKTILSQKTGKGV
ncbi:phage baseplate protein [Gallibacterium anatis]|uniref:Dit-like phage tail protein N-terminal domain-containing protein n=1 Tax=Gallibacterium anatis 4895 TaxID=1396510 RepID=A0A0A2ZWH5_9PAST|nr:hypothetical protein [Gallibacterium anatis]KGQ61411.1 hypothetical protein IO48_07650 [Gallibacterium anatis 4895]